MSDLQSLLKRIQPEQKKTRYKMVSLEPSPYLVALLGRMEARRWREEQMALTVEYLRECADEIKFIQHLRTCRECQLEASLSVERYGGRGLPWFFDMNNFDVFLDENNENLDTRFRDCPRIQNYRIGSYWDNTTDHNETMKFINDRITWAEKHIRQQIWIAVDYYKLLKEWDLNEPYPVEETLPF